jgi:sugar phosphate isomerase/epimerase
MNKRNFVKSLMLTPAFFSLGLGSQSAHSWTRKAKDGRPLKISLNAYSFNQPLSEGEMDLNQLLEFCADHHFDAVDPTGYYFPGYPEVPPDAFLYELKMKAFRLGLEISGTGVRNDFTDPDPSKRNKDIALVKNWVLAAKKMGIPVIRIFSGVQNPDGFTWNQVEGWMMQDIRECVEFGKNHGVVIALQNHNDFIQTAGQVVGLMKKINSPWFGLILDTGSYPTGDPYEEIAMTIPYAVSWQIKEKINNRGKEEEVDLDKLMSIIKAAGYRGYLPIETLGPGDPYEKVPIFLEKVRVALNKIEN